MKKRGFLGLILAMVMMLISVTEVFAAFPGVSRTQYMKTYPISTGNNTPVYTSSGFSSKKGTIYAGDELYVTSIGNNWAYCTYPISKGRKEGYIRLSAISPNNMSHTVNTARAQINVYRRSNLSQYYGYVSKGDSVTAVAQSGSATQVIYSIGNGQKKMGWVSTENYKNYIRAIDGPIANGRYILEAKCGKAMDICNGSKANCANVQLCEKNNTFAQVFYVEYYNNGNYFIMNHGSGKVLDVDNFSQANGANILQYDWKVSINQFWKIVPTSDGYFEIVSAMNTGKAIDISGGGTENGTNIQLWDRNGTNAQKWKFVPWNGGNTSTPAPAPAPVNSFDPIWPCQNTYAVSALYKYSSGSKHSTRFKYGIDIPAPKGENVLAVESGTVITSEYSYSSGFGNWIMIKHDNGKVSLYAHLSQRKVSNGTRVSKGQVIGLVGNTSAKYNIGSHLHFELGNSNTGGAAGDPWAEYFKPKYGSKIRINCRTDK